MAQEISYKCSPAFRPVNVLDKPLGCTCCRLLFRRMQYNTFVQHQITDSIYFCVRRSLKLPVNLPQFLNVRLIYHRSGVGLFSLEGISQSTASASDGADKQGVHNQKEGGTPPHGGAPPGPGAGSAERDARDRVRNKLHIAPINLKGHRPWNREPPCRPAGRSQSWNLD